MNKLSIVNNQIDSSFLDDNVRIEPFLNDPLTDVDILKIDILKDTYLYIDYNFLVNSKLNIIINILDEADVTIFDFKKGLASKIKNDFYLGNNSTLTINRFYDVEEINELNNTYLNGLNSKVDFIFKTISKNSEKYDYIFNHSNHNTISNINNSGVSIKDGEIAFDITSIVPKGFKNCYINQESSIINLNDKNSTINPNLLIEDNDIVANHGAFIGKFNELELFYLMSRGIRYEQALNLLIKGFLKSNLNIDEESLTLIDNIINSYWR